MRTVYVIGVPGSGKTTVVRDALRLLALEPVVEYIVPIPHVRHGTLWHLGRHREPFGGTDTLAMNINPKAIAWVANLVHLDGGPDADTPSVLLGEGDRLANNAFLAACPDLTVVWLDTPIPDARARAAARAAELDQPAQADSWWKGRVTKVRNLVDSRPVHRLDGARTSGENASDLAELLAAT